jgi:hypothetical protein
LERLTHPVPHAAGDLWASVRAAAAGARHGAAGRVAELATVGGTPRLGWVLPPPWPVVRAALRDALPTPARPGTLLLVGTGGWSFGARAAAESAETGHCLRVLDRLDPGALSETGRSAGPAALVAVSESGRTLETARLTAALSARTRLTPVRLSGARIGLVPRAATVALFAAPLSTPFLLAMAAVYGDTLEDAYARFSTWTEPLGEWAADASGTVAGERHVRLRVTGAEGEARSGFRLFALQALRQALGGKSGGSGPRWDVGPRAVPGEAVVELPELPTDLPAPARLMTRLYGICALTACLGLRLGLNFADHPAVHRYKRLVGRVEPRPGYVDPRDSADHLAPLLRGLGRRGVLHVVSYEHASDETRTTAQIRAALRRRPDARVEFHTGSSWNHHSYQAVATDPQARVLAWTPAEDGDPLTALQRDIAAATCASLPGRAVLLQAPGPRRRSQP